MDALYNEVFWGWAGHWGDELEGSWPCGRSPDARLRELRKTPGPCFWR